MQKTLDQITKSAQQALGDNLVSLVLYGSHPRGEAHSRSDINLFIVVKDSHVSALQPLAQLVPGWIKLGAAAPVIFEQDQLERSRDTFALELAEIACVHQILIGADPFDGYTPDWIEVRSELEHELRQKTIYLKRRWMAAGSDDKALRAVLAETVPGYVALLRGALMLQRHAIAPLTVTLVLDELQSWPWFKPEVWKRLINAGRGQEKISAAELPALLVEYIEQVRAFVRHIDQMPVVS